MSIDSGIAPEVRESNPAPRTPRWRSVLTESNAVAGLACLTALLYALWTQHTWEDYFITYRHSQNLCEGKGLVYTPGERVHGFTSPLGALLPALCNWATGQTSYRRALWLYRALCILAFAGGGVLLVRGVRATDPKDWLAPCFTAVLYILDGQALEFTTDGMETAFMLLFLAWALYLFATPRPGLWLARGLCWAGLMWTRPDSCIYIAALAAAELLFAGRRQGPALRSLAGSVAVCTALYLPWFLWAWSYYGSPIPHTIIAKSADLAGGGTDQLKVFLGDLFHRYFVAAQTVFHPIYYWGDAWVWGAPWTQELVIGWVPYLAVFCSIYWLLPVDDRLGRMASFCFTVVDLYLGYLDTLFPWYTVPPLMLGLVVLTRGVVTLTAAVGRWAPFDPVYGRRRALAVAVLLVLALRWAILAGFTGLEMKIQQKEIETGVRTKIGLWLKERVAPQEIIFTECFGYIGYFSQARIFDFPGLSSPEVVCARRKVGMGLDEILLELRPDWLVLRPYEVEATPPGGYVDMTYALVRVFDVSDRLAQYKILPGASLLYLDSTFYVFRRLPAEAEPRPYEEVPLSVTPSATHDLTWQDGVAQATGEAPSITFPLPRPRHVTAIRLKFSYENTASPASVTVRWWKGGPEPDHAQGLSWRQKTDAGECTRTVWVDGTIDQIRLSPDNKSRTLRLTKVLLLVPPEEEQAQP